MGRVGRSGEQRNGKRPSAKSLGTVRTGGWQCGTTVWNHRWQLQGDAIASDASEAQGEFLRQPGGCVCHLLGRSGEPPVGPCEVLRGFVHQSLTRGIFAAPVILTREELPVARTLASAKAEDSERWHIGVIGVPKLFKSP